MAMALATIVIAGEAGCDQTLAEVVKQLVLAGLVLSVKSDRGGWVIEVTGY
jgi:DNA-binding IscR family transcriptional regulator